MIGKWWHRAFLVERSSVSLSLFRFAVAWTVGAHMIPSILHLEDNYFASAFRSYNSTFFPIPILRWVDGHPDIAVMAMVWMFFVGLAAFTVGIWTRLSAIVMTLGCYYFYARNPYHIGTLSFDILLVTLFLVCITPYLGDSFSIDSLRRANPKPWAIRRPYFIQRLLQLQIASTYFCTAVSKSTGEGNWISDNPIYSLMHYPPMGVVRDFPGRDWLADRPEFCYAVGISVVVFEYCLPLLLFIPRLRWFGIVTGIAFQFMIWATLHVPTIFVFLFPPMLLLFIDSDRVMEWIERRRRKEAVKRRPLLLFDGDCGFCRRSVDRLQAADIFGKAEIKDFRTADLPRIHSQLEHSRMEKEMVLVSPDGRLYGGFDAFRRLCHHAWLFKPLLPLMYFPGVRWIGSRVYRFVAANRFLFSSNTCSTKSCSNQ